MSPSKVFATAATLAAIVVARPAAATAQLARVDQPEENLRLEPRGTKLATLLRGTTLRVVAAQGPWRRVTLEGWIWTPSVSATQRDGFDLRVSRRGGENLRESPSAQGRRLAVLLEGCLLERLGSQGNWTHVRRTAWVWAASLAEEESPAAAAAEGGDAPAGGPVAERGREPDVAEASGSEREEAETARARAGSDRILVGEAPVRLLTSPDGDTLGVAEPGADLQVIGRQGSWARVRLDGWVWLPSTIPADSAVGSDRPTAADLRANPDRYVGQRVRWKVKFYSLERAEAIRTDFYEGEPFMLAGAPDPADGLVYIAVPPEQLPAVEALRPLQTVEVLARVRTGRSALMQTPVLDLVAIY